VSSCHGVRHGARGRERGVLGTTHCMHTLRRCFVAVYHRDVFSVREHLFRLSEKLATAQRRAASRASARNRLLAVSGGAGSLGHAKSSLGGLAGGAGRATVHHAKSAAAGLTRRGSGGSVAPPGGPRAGGGVSRRTSASRLVDDGGLDTEREGDWEEVDVVGGLGDDDFDVGGADGGHGHGGGGALPHQHAFPTGPLTLDRILPPHHAPAKVITDADRSLASLHSGLLPSDGELEAMWKPNMLLPLESGERRRAVPWQSPSVSIVSASLHHRGAVASLRELMQLFNMQTVVTALDKAEADRLRKVELECKQLQGRYDRLARDAQSLAERHAMLSDSAINQATKIDDLERQRRQGLLERDRLQRQVEDGDQWRRMATDNLEVLKARLRDAQAEIAAWKYKGGLLSPAKTAPGGGAGGDAAIRSSPTTPHGQDGGSGSGSGSVGHGQRRGSTRRRPSVLLSPLQTPGSRGDGTTFAFPQTPGTRGGSALLSPGGSKRPPPPPPRPLSGKAGGMPSPPPRTSSAGARASSSSSGTAAGGGSGSVPSTPHPRRSVTGGGTTPHRATSSDSPAALASPVGRPSLSGPRRASLASPTPTAASRRRASAGSTGPSSADSTAVGKTSSTPHAAAAQGAGGRRGSRPSAASAASPASGEGAGGLPRPPGAAGRRVSFAESPQAAAASAVGPGPATRRGSSSSPAPAFTFDEVDVAAATTPSQAGRMSASGSSSAAAGTRATSAHTTGPTSAFAGGGRDSFPLPAPHRATDSAVPPALSAAEAPAVDVTDVEIGAGNPSAAVAPRTRHAATAVVVPSPPRSTRTSSQATGVGGAAKHPTTPAGAPPLMAVPRPVVDVTGDAAPVAGWAVT